MHHTGPPLGLHSRAPIQIFTGSGANPQKNQTLVPAKKTSHLNIGKRGRAGGAQIRVKRC